MVATEFVDSLVEMPGQFADVAAHDPISAVLVAMGAVLVTAPLGLFGVLTLGAVVEFIVPDSTESSHP
jgi:hypothetical protein